MQTKKPCPGCGEVSIGRKVDAVCAVCAHAIKMWTEHTARITADPAMVVIRLKGSPHWYPMFYIGGPHASVEGHSETRDELGRLFFDLGHALSTDRLNWDEVPHELREKAEALYFRPDFRHPMKKGANYAERIDYPASEGQGSCSDSYATIDGKVLGLLRALWDRTARFAEMCYYGGVLDGKNLLFELASGEMSSSDLEKEDVRLAQRVQNVRDLHRRVKSQKVKATA